MKPPQKQQQQQQQLTTKSDNRKKHKKGGGISDRSFAEKNMTIIEGKEEKKKREGEVEEEEEEEEARDSIKAWEEKNSNPGWNVVESSCPLSEEQVREVEAYFLAGKKRGRLVPKYAKFLAKSIATVAILPVGKRITREAHQKMQKENFCVVRGYSQKNVKHASEHHIGPSARRSEQTHPV
ncbi:unnamed protein product [Bathycoccus prasinos]|jgi:hypothetical protein